MELSAAVDIDMHFAWMCFMYENGAHEAPSTDKIQEVEQIEIMHDPQRCSKLP